MAQPEVYALCITWKSMGLRDGSCYPPKIKIFTKWEEAQAVFHKSLENASSHWHKITDEKYESTDCYFQILRITIDEKDYLFSL